MDFNARSIEEQLYVDYPEISDPLQEFLQELDILFSIDKGTVFCQRSIGADIERMLWSTSFNASLIEHRISEAIELNCQSKITFIWDASVSLLKGMNKDIGVITIHIKNQDNVLIEESTYVFK